jgi:hypothetical protein
MSEELKVVAIVKTSDGKIEVEIDASEWIRDCGGDSFLLEHWDDGFRHLAREFEWAEDDDDPAVMKVLEHLWAAQDRGEEIDVACTIDGSQVMPFIKAFMPKHFRWMEQWIRSEGGDPFILPDPV